MPRDNDPKPNTPSPVGGMGVSFCTPGYGGRVCKDGQHTTACKSREQLCRNLVDWLRDQTAEKQRIQIVRDFGPLTMMDMFVGFSRWFALRSMDLWQAGDAESHMAISRGIPDLGSFNAAFRVAELIVQDERMRKSIQAEGLF